MPADGDAVRELERVRLEFSGALLDIGAELVVTSDDAAPRGLEVELVRDRVVEANVPALAAGAYVLEWRVVAQDGHPLDGIIAFDVVAPPPREGPTPASTPEPDASASAYPSASPVPFSELTNGDFGEQVSQRLSPLDAALIALAGAVLVGVAWLITRRVSARERDALSR